MTAGDIIPLRRQFTDERIADFKQRAAGALHKYSADESIPQGDTSVHDILAAIHPWEFELERDRDGSPGMYGEYGYMRLEQALKQLELGVEDWVLSAAPPWAGVISEVVWHDAETPQEIEHSTRHAYVPAPDAGHEEEPDGGQLAVYLVRTDKILDERNAVEGQVLVGVSERSAASETKVLLDDLLAVIRQLQVKS